MWEVHMSVMWHMVCLFFLSQMLFNSLIFFQIYKTNTFLTSCQKTMDESSQNC